MSRQSYPLIRISAVVIAFTFAARFATAAELLDWKLTTVTGPAANNSAFVGVPAATATIAANLVASDLVTASSPGHEGLVWSAGNAGSNQLNLQRWDHPNDDPAQTGNGNGNPNNWLQFLFGAALGYEFNIQSIDFSAWRNATGSPAAWSVQTSDDNGDTWTNFGSVHTESNQGDSIFRSVHFTGSVTASTLLIRFIATGLTGGTGNLHINKMVLNGSVSQVVTGGNAVLVSETFNGSAAVGLTGRSPSINLLSSDAVWSADPIVAANGQVTDGTNTDRGASLDLGAGFAFQVNKTYTLSLGWTSLDNAILFAGFNTAAPSVNAQIQTQGTNFAVRARRIAAGTDTLATWKNPGASATSGTIATPAAGTATLTLETRSLSDATFTIDGLAAPTAIDLTAGFRYLWIGFEDPTAASPGSDGKFTSLTLSGPVPSELQTPPVVTILPDSLLVPEGQLVTLAATPAGAAIHYTLNGATPDVNSALYTAPFPLGASTTVRAIAISSENVTGPVASRSFTLQQPIGTPNLLIVVGGNVGFGDLQCYGGVNIATPTLDSLACDGIRFTQFTTTGPGNPASQYALLTGRVAARSGLGASVSAGASGWQSEEWTLAEVLRRRLYSTAFIGEWLMGNAAGSHPNDQGFHLFHGLPYASAANPPLEENHQVLTASPDPELLLDQLTTRARSFIASATSPFALVFQPPVIPASGSSIAGPHGNRIEALDHAVGQLLAELDAGNLASNTLVLFVGDGGAPRTVDGGSNGLLRDGSGTTWEGGMRTPLLARLPGTLPARQMNLSLVWLPDLMPTLASLLGGNLASDRPLDGTPRPAVLTGAQTRPVGDETAFGFRFQNNAWQLATVRQGTWKSHLSIINIDPQNTNATTGSQLYDLHIDAEERINRSSQQPAMVSRLQGLASSLTASLPAAGTTDLPPPKQPVLNGVSTTLDGSPRAVRFSFSRPADSLDDNYRIEHSSDLSSWESLAMLPYLTALTPAEGNNEDLEVSVELETPPFDGERRFVRFRASRPANP